MSKFPWKRTALAMLCGAVLLQTPACTETSLIVSSLANVVTAGGVVYLVTQVLD